MIGLFILGAVAGAYAVIAYMTAPTVLQQQAAGHFFVVAAVLVGAAAVIEAVDRAGKSITGQLRKLREESAENAARDGVTEPPSPQAGP